MRDPATYRGKRRERAKEVTKRPGATIEFPQAWEAVKSLFAKRKPTEWKAAAHAGPAARAAN